MYEKITPNTKNTYFPLVVLRISEASLALPALTQIRGWFPKETDAHSSAKRAGFFGNGVRFRLLLSPAKPRNDRKHNNPGRGKLKRFEKDQSRPDSALIGAARIHLPIVGTIFADAIPQAGFGIAQDFCYCAFVAQSCPYICRYYGWAKGYEERKAA